MKQTKEINTFLYWNLHLYFTFSYIEINGNHKFMKLTNANNNSLIPLWPVFYREINIRLALLLHVHINEH